MHTNKICIHVYAKVSEISKRLSLLIKLKWNFSNAEIITFEIIIKFHKKVVIHLEHFNFMIQTCHSYMAKLTYEP